MINVSHKHNFHVDAAQAPTRVVKELLFSMLMQHFRTRVSPERLTTSKLQITTSVIIYYILNNVARFVGVVNKADGFDSLKIILSLWYHHLTFPIWLVHLSWIDRKELAKDSIFFFRSLKIIVCVYLSFRCKIVQHLENI